MKHCARVVVAELAAPGLVNHDGGPCMPCERVVRFCKPGKGKEEEEEVGNFIIRWPHLFMQSLDFSSIA